MRVIYIYLCVCACVSILLIVLEIDLEIIMSRKDFSDLSQRQKRRIVLNECNSLNVLGLQSTKKTCIEEIDSINNSCVNNSESDNVSITPNLLFTHFYISCHNKYT